MAPTDDKEMYMMVGEIRSDVKKLLERSNSTDKRVGALEKKWWTTLAAVGVFVPVAIAKAFGFH